MTRKSFFALVTASALLALLLTSGGPGLAQGQGPQSPQVPQAQVGTAFTYQGQLKNAGNPVTASCGMAFRLYNDPDSGSQVGDAITTTVPVTNGLFTVMLNDVNQFGPNAFNGDARWLQVAVECPSDAGFVTLTPRQAVTPAPYALTLPGLVTQQNITSTNLIGGYSGNIITPGKVGAAIGGGGNNIFPNRVTADYGTVSGGDANAASGIEAVVGGGFGNTAGGQNSTVGGGWGNVANNWHSTVGGGLANTASGDKAVIGGGHGNIAGGFLSTIAGGYSNTASYDNTAIGGGSLNLASGNYATVGGGYSNTVSFQYSTVGGGYANVASGGYMGLGGAATVGGGWHNTASGTQSTVAGGVYNVAGGYDSAVCGGESNQAVANDATVGGGAANIASGKYATVPGGIGAAASHYGEMAYSSGWFGTAGDAQTSVYVLRRQTADASQMSLFLDGESTSQRLTIAPGRAVAFDILVVARSNTAATAGYRIWGVIGNSAGTTTMIGASGLVLGADPGASSWNAVAAADDINDALDIRVTGAASTVIHWVAVVHTVEVAW